VYIAGGLLILRRQLMDKFISITLIICLSIFNLNIFSNVFPSDKDKIILFALSMILYFITDIFHEIYKIKEKLENRR